MAPKLRYAGITLQLYFIYFIFIFPSLYSPIHLWWLDHLKCEKNKNWLSVFIDDETRIHLCKSLAQSPIVSCYAEIQVQGNVNPKVAI